MQISSRCRGGISGGKDQYRGLSTPSAKNADSGRDDKPFIAARIALNARHSAAPFVLGEEV
jgi:hypothetical protein